MGDQSQNQSLYYNQNTKAVITSNKSLLFAISDWVYYCHHLSLYFGYFVNLYFKTTDTMRVLNTIVRNISLSHIIKVAITI